MAYLSDDARRVAIAARKARVERIVSRFLASRKPLEQRPTTAAMIYLHESILTDGDAEDVERCEIGGVVLNASPLATRAILPAVLRALAQAPLEAPSWQVNVIGNVRFVHDYHWGMLIKAILRTRPSADEDFVQALLERLADLAERFESNFPKNSYPFPFASVVRFLHRHVPACSIARLTPSIQALLDSLKKAVKNDLMALKGYREEEAESLAANPENWFKKTDRTAVELIESWVSR